MARFKQQQLPKTDPTLSDYIKIQDGRLVLSAPLETNNFVAGKRGVQIRQEGLNSSGGTIQGVTITGGSVEAATTITGALTHTGSTAGFYNTSPIAKQTVTLGNTNSAIGGLTISAAYSQAEVQALRDATEVLADDVRALKTALANLGLIT